MQYLEERRLKKRTRDGGHVKKRLQRSHSYCRDFLEFLEPFRRWSAVTTTVLAHRMVVRDGSGCTIGEYSLSE